LKFEYLSSDRIKVVLTAQDIADSGIDFESDDEKDIKRLKGYLFFLLSKIKLQYDAATEDASLYIEIYPQRTGGALIYFIIDRGHHNICEPLVFCFENSNDLIKAASALYSNYSHRLYKSALYQYKSCWLLIIRPLDGNLSPAATLLMEYGELIDSDLLTSAVIQEHCKPIIRERAADMLFYYLG